MNLAREARMMQDQLVELRRQIHQQPEVGLSLPTTQQTVLSAIRDLPLEIATGAGLTSVVAVLRGAGPGAGTVLLRADMDALPVAELTGLEFAAPGDAMHACGHDLHIAMLCGAAKMLSSHRDALAGDIVFMFQPGEEGHDGARQMIQEGVVRASGRAADAAFALHVMSAMLPSGVVATRPGTLMASGDLLRVTVRGAGGHGSMPHRARDPIPAAAEMVIALQTLATRRFDVFDPVVITVGTFHAGTAHNVIPDQARFEATLRSFSPDAHTMVREQAVQVCRGIAVAHGLQVDIDCDTLFPVCVNDDAEAAFASQVAQDLFGAGRSVTLPVPLTGSEDFSLVLNAVPGAMAFLGACPPGSDPATAPFNHSPQAVFDETVLADGAALYTTYAIQRLAAMASSPKPRGLKRSPRRSGQRGFSSLRRDSRRIPVARHHSRTLGGTGASRRTWSSAARTASSRPLSGPPSSSSGVSVQAFRRSS